MLGNISSLCVFYILSVLPRWQSGESGSRACGFKASARGVVYVSGLYVIFSGVYETCPQCISDGLMHVVHAKFAEDVFAVCIDGVEA